MKHNSILLLAAAALLTSCGTSYVVTDSVGRRLDGTRTVLAPDSTSLDESPYALWHRTPLESPRVFDFRSQRDTMRYAYSQALPRGGWTVMADSLARQLRPQVTVSRSFRWFTTRYRYEALFPALDSLPVPVADYLSDEEQRLLFMPSEVPADWNGAEMYALLDKLNTKYVRWWSHCLFEKEYEIYRSYADSSQRVLLAHYHDTLLALTLADVADDRQESLKENARLFPALAFLSDIASGNDVQLAVMAWYEANCNLDTRVLWRIELPGRRSAECMVSAERLVMGDYAVELTSRTVNWWAVVLTLAVALVLIWLPWGRKMRR